MNHSLSIDASVMSRLPLRSARQDALTPAQRKALVAAIVLGHVALAWGLLQVREVRDAVKEAAPIFVSWMAAPPHPEAPPPPKPAAPKPTPPAPKHVIAAESTPSPTPPAFTAPPPPPEPVAPSLPAVQAAPTPPPPAAVPAPPPAPRQIPASAVQYVEAPVLVYPRASRRAGEAGRVVLRVFIDEAGLPRQATVSQSTGFPRLDEAAVAAVQKARFKPYTDNGQPVAGWALVPLSFDLEK